jgi:hypothetical protein
VEWGRGGAIMRYTAAAEGQQLRGQCWNEGDEAHKVEWGGMRVM